MKLNLIIYIFLANWTLLLSSPSKSAYYNEIAQSQKLIMDVYKYTINNYADELDLKEYTKTTLRNMVDGLDPYTVYMEEEERTNIDMLTKGKYGGVGLQISKNQGKLTVIAPFDGTPAAQAGIQSGDIISKIDSTSTKELTSTDAARLIRGKKGTIVILFIKRSGFDELIEFPLVRADIKIKDVAWHGMINENIGYVRLTRFSKNSAGEMKNAFSNLLKEDSQGIIIDLRDNPGGLLQSSIDILDMLIPKGKTLLSTKGRIKKSNREFKSKNEPLVPEHIKIAVLINNGSASASEIVSGAIQDLDRGVVIGRKSFGKGLVQSVYGLDEKRSLKLTTAKYFIPSGRLIQKEGYIDKKIITKESKIDSIFYTYKGRKVKGGGGISPDIDVNTRKFGPLTTACWRKGLFFSFVQEEKNNYENLIEVKEDNSLLSDFSSFIKNKDIEITLSGGKSFEDTKNKLLKLDSTNVKLLSAFNDISKFLKEKEHNLIIEESEDIYQRLILKFADHFEGTSGKFIESFKWDTDVKQALKYLSDSQAYNYIFSVDNLSN